MQPANGHSSQCACIKLAFSTDVKQPGLEGDGGSKPGQDERNRARQGFAQRKDRAKTALEQQAVSLA